MTRHNRPVPATRIRLAMAALVAIAVFVVGAASASAASLPAGSTALMSGQPSLFEPFAAPVGYSSAGTSSVSQDGRYVAFTSASDGLVAGDDDRAASVYRKDMETGEVLLVSRRDGASGEPSHGLCDDAAISDDGQRVAFVCEQSLDNADANGHEDVYVRTVNAGTTTLVSRVGAGGPAGNAGSRRPALSQDGAYVAFESTATDLVDGVDGSPHVYRRRLAAQETILIGRADGPSGAPVESSEPSISDDGSVVAFASGQAVDTTVDKNGVSDVYVRDVFTDTTTLASRANLVTGAVGNGGSYSPEISGNGLGVAFTSNATNLDPGDTGTESNVYVRTGLQFTSLVDVRAGGGKSGAGSIPSIDDSGRLIAFVSDATGLDPADTDSTPDVYVKNIADGSVRLASRATGPGGLAANREAWTAAISGDGLKVASELANGGITPDADPRRSSVILRDTTAQVTRSVARPAGSAPFVNVGGNSSEATLSADGRFAAFTSDAPGLGLPLGPRDGVFVRDRMTGAVTLASRADGSDGAPFADVTGRAAISADGRRVTFSASAQPGDTRQVWVRDIAEQKTFLASRADGPAGAPGDGASRGATLDADGTRVAFHSLAKNLGDGDTDDSEDVHLRDLASGDTILVSRANGTAGAKGDGASLRPDIDAGGTRVTFLSGAANLGDGDTDRQTDVHLRDLTAGVTRLVNATPAGTKDNEGVVNTPSIDAAGNRVAFVSSGTNLGDLSPDDKVFVRDFGANTLTVAVKGYDAKISPDGGYIAFSSGGRVMRHDLTTLQTELASRRSGVGGAPATGEAMLGDISNGGASVSFTAADSLVGPAHDSFESYLRVFTADGGAPSGGGDGGGSGEPGGGGGPGGPGNDGPGTAPLDKAAPVLSDTRLSHRRFRVARDATAVAAAVSRGTLLRFRSSEAGVLRIAIQRVRRGQRPRLRAAGTLTRRIPAGASRIRLSGRIGRRALRPGGYLLRLSAVDGAGNRSATRVLPFQVVR